MQRGGLFAQMNKSDIISLAEPIPLTAKLQDVKKRKEKLPIVKIVTIKTEYESLSFPHRFQNPSSLSDKPHH